MDKQFESPYKKQRPTGPNTSDQNPSGNDISASEYSGKALSGIPTTKPIRLTVEALNLCDAPMLPGMGSGLRSGSHPSASAPTTHHGAAPQRNLSPVYRQQVGGRQPS